MPPKDPFADEPLGRALTEFRKVDWTDGTGLEHELQRLEELPIVTHVAANYSTEGLLAALRDSIDLALIQWRKEEMSTALRNHERERLSPFAYAGALLFRRPDALAPGEVDTICGCEDLRESLTVLGGPPSAASSKDRVARWLGQANTEEVRVAICLLWKNHSSDLTISSGHFQNRYQDDVVIRMVRTLRDLGKNLEWQRPVIERFRPSDLKVGFWWRDSTVEYVKQVAQLAPVTLFAGADGHSDVGEPLHSALGRLFLESSLPFSSISNKVDLSQVDASEIASYFGNRSPAFIGSMIRGLAAQAHEDQTSIAPRLAEVAHRVSGGSEWSKDARRTRAFVGSRVTDLAQRFAERRCDVSIVNAHNDRDIANALEAAAPWSGRIDLFALHPGEGVRQAQSVLSEADLFVERIEVDGVELTWHDFLTERLTFQKAIFVGTDIRSPGLVAALVRSRRRARYPRFAVLLPPANGPWDEPQRQPKEGEEDWENRLEHWLSRKALYYMAMAGRYVDLGVVPIIVDFPYQVPQFLREVELCLQQGPDNYVPYRKRCDDWWDDCKDAFGLGDAGDAIPARDEWQQHWHRTLVRMRRETEDRLAPSDIAPKDRERLLFEIWIRNPKRREFFLWATSDQLLERTHSSPVASLKETGGVIQQAFREGNTQTSQVTRAPWRFCAALPLVLEDNLPVGVMRILSTKEDGELKLITRTPMAVFEAPARGLVEAMMETLPTRKPRSTG